MSRIGAEFIKILQIFIILHCYISEIIFLINKQFSSWLETILKRLTALCVWKANKKLIGIYELTFQVHDLSSKEIRDTWVMAIKERM